MELKYDAVDYLRGQPQAWVRYQLAKGLGAGARELAEKKLALRHDPWVIELIEDIAKWPEPPLIRHNDARHPIHKIQLLLDMGFDESDDFIRGVTEKILDQQDPSGALLSLLHIPQAYGGAPEPAFGWLSCDFPLLLCILLRQGLGGDARVKAALEFLIANAFDNGWRCTGSCGKFRGPGKKDDYCPIGTLYALQACALVPSLHNEAFIHAAIDSLIYHWENTAERKVYMFAMGTDFRKLKYPNHWFDILHVIQVLGNYQYATSQAAFKEMANIVANKQQPDGSFIPESIYMSYKGWDFGQKKTSSPTLTWAVWDILKNIG